MQKLIVRKGGRIDSGEERYKGNCRVGTHSLHYTSVVGLGSIVSNLSVHLVETVLRKTLPTCGQPEVPTRQHPSTTE